jgi:hypothetical protein
VRRPMADVAQQAAAQRASDARDLHPRGWAENGPIGPAGLSAGARSQWRRKGRSGLLGCIEEKRKYVEG